jgi:transposase
MKQITLNKAYDLIDNCAAVIIDLDLLYPNMSKLTGEGKHQFLFLDEGSIANYRKRYKEGGLEGLILDEYCTRRTRLNESEEIELVAELDAKIFASTKEVVSHIEKNFKITFSVSGCNNLLHRLGFSFKKAKGIPGKAKIEDQIDFIQKYDLMKDLGGKIYFGDATHPLHNTILSSGWIKRLPNSRTTRERAYDGRNIHGRHFAAYRHHDAGYSRHPLRWRIPYVLRDHQSAH